MQCHGQGEAHMTHEVQEQRRRRLLAAFLGPLHDAQKLPPTASTPGPGRNAAPTPSSGRRTGRAESWGQGWGKSRSKGRGRSRDWDGRHDVRTADPEEVDEQARAELYREIVLAQAVQELARVEAGDERRIGRDGVLSRPGEGVVRLLPRRVGRVGRNGRGGR
jgi:hypothetical protein